MNNNRGTAGPPQSSDQYALSLLVNAAEGRDSPRQRIGSDSRFAEQGNFGLRGLTGSSGFSGGDASLEEQLLLQQHGFGGGNNGALLNQLRDHGLLSQLSQQQQLAALLNIGGGSGGAGSGGNAPTSSMGAGSWNPEMRQALAAAQFRPNQTTPSFSQADILALSRSGALSGLLGGGGSGNTGSSSFGGSTSGAASYGSSGAGTFGGASAGDYGGSQSFAAELEGLQRLEELNRRQRLLAASEASRPNLDRGLAAAQGLIREQQQQQLQQQQLQLQQQQQKQQQQQQPPAPAQPSQPPAPAPAPSAPQPPAQQEPEPQPLPQLSDTPKRAEASPKVKAEPAPPVETVSKEEVEKTPGSVIVPCRARGMPMDHNFKTAYFVIPENVKHGEELICSYFACRNAGIKFRYCSHCKVPVAKRNFRKRHKHGGDVADKGDDSGGEDDEVTKTGIPSQITAGHEEEAEADGISSQSGDSTNHQEEKAKVVTTPVVTVDLQQGLVRTSMMNFEANKIKDAPASTTEKEEVQNSEKISAEREARWLSLLAKRPSTKDSDTMSGWLMDVLAVSDLDTPLDGSGPKDLTTASEELISKAKKRSDAAEKNETGPNEEGEPNGKSNHESEAPKDGSDMGHGDGIVKKKRPKEDLDETNDDDANKSDKYASGSFAAWKERKKQRKQSKGSSDVSGVSTEESG